MQRLLAGSPGHGAVPKVPPDFTFCSPVCARSLLPTLLLRGTRRHGQAKVAAPSADSGREPEAQPGASSYAQPRRQHLLGCKPRYWRSYFGEYSREQFFLTSEVDEEAGNRGLSNCLSFLFLCISVTKYLISTKKYLDDKTFS